MRQLRRAPWGAGGCLCPQDRGSPVRQGVEVTTPSTQGAEDEGGCGASFKSPEVETPVAQEGSGEVEVKRVFEPAP